MIADYSRVEIGYVLSHFEARGPLTVAQLVYHTRLRLRVVLAILRDLQRRDEVRPLQGRDGVYKLLRPQFIAHILARANVA